MNTKSILRGQERGWGVGNELCPKIPDSSNLGRLARRKRRLAYLQRVDFENLGFWTLLTLWLLEEEKVIKQLIKKLRWLDPVSLTRRSATFLHTIHINLVI